MDDGSRHDTLRGKRYAPQKIRDRVSRKIRPIFTAISATSSRVLNVSLLDRRCLSRVALTQQTLSPSLACALCSVQCIRFAMTTKHSTTPQTTTSATVTTPSSTSTATAAAATRQAAQILYRMANSGGTSTSNVVAAGTSSTTTSSSLVTEPITPVLLAAAPTMLNPASAHFAVTTTASFNQTGGSGLQQAHNFIPVYFQSPVGGGVSGQLKQDSTSTMTFQFQPQQYQVIQQQAQPLQGGRTVYQLNIGGGGGDNPQYQVARMAAVAGVNQQQQPQHQGQPQQLVGKGRAGGRKSNTKEDKLSSEEMDRRKVRRERNKQAAARCRKRRMDQTNILTDETEALEAVQNDIKSEIEKYQLEITEIQSILDTHRANCGKNIPATSVHMRVHSPPRIHVQVPPTSVNDSMIMPPPPTIVVPSSAPEPIATAAPATTDEPGAKRKTGSALQRPSNLPGPLQQLDLLAMPTPSPSKLVFNFESHTGLTPTGLTPTGLTPLIPSISSDAPEKTDTSSSAEAGASAAQQTSPNNLVSL
ncbi:hypothetical protein BV898_05375 [Hypsibius exemplaris]|uniref:BZIP domain-containing protein n=1 Tax=Hypsibius exemplaris TaxID=2072580 RepID=A0A1W0WZC9_HYPEX|nr:hypothetical protein BV898_05375 [Hypsibius exemplaris]